MKGTLRRVFTGILTDKRYCLPALPVILALWVRPTRYRILKIHLRQRLFLWRDLLFRMERFHMPGVHCIQRKPFYLARHLPLWLDLSASTMHEWWEAFRAEVRAEIVINFSPSKTWEAIATSFLTVNFLFAPFWRERLPKHFILWCCGEVSESHDLPCSSPLGRKASFKDCYDRFGAHSCRFEFVEWLRSNQPNNSIFR